MDNIYNIQNGVIQEPGSFELDSNKNSPSSRTNTLQNSIFFGTRTLQQLPYELKQHILSYLTAFKDIISFGKTCTEFWKLAKIHAPLYIKFSKKSLLSPQQLIQCLTPLNLFNLRTLDLSNCKYVNDETIEVIAQRCETLEKLYMGTLESLLYRRFRETNEVVMLFLSSLIAASLLPTNIPGDAPLKDTKIFIVFIIIDIFLLVIFLLTHPRLNMPSKENSLTSEGLKQLLHLKKLKELEILIKTPSLTDNNSDWDIAIANILLQLDQLESLSISGDWKNWLDVYATARLLTQPIPNLRQLSIKGCSDETAPSINFLKTHNLTNLEAFEYIPSPSERSHPPYMIAI